MEIYLPYIFTLNIFLTLADASIGYFVAPILVRLVSDDEEATELALRKIRSLLATVVSLYMFFNCAAYFRREAVLLLVVSGVILVDIVSQLVVRNRYLHRGET